MPLQCVVYFLYNIIVTNGKTISIVCTYILCVYVCAHTHVCTCVCTTVCTHKFVCVCPPVHACMHVCVCACVGVGVCVFMCIHACVVVRTYICVYDMCMCIQ